MSSINLYQKLKKGEDISVLIIGDSIGYGSNSTSFETSWAGLIKNEIKEKFGSSAEITNLSVGGTDSLFGYSAFMRQNFSEKADLVILCHGENDSESDFAFNYEGLIASVLLNNPECEVLCILESSQREYTPKIKTICRIAEHYNCAVADTISEFMASGADYTELADEDMVHPNDEGHRLYAKAVTDTLAEGVIQQKRKAEFSGYIDERVSTFEKYRFIPKTDMERKGNSLFVRACGDIISYSILEAPDGFEYEVYVNSEFTVKRSVKHEHYWVWERLYIVKCEKYRCCDIELKFNDPNDIDRVLGASVIG